MLSRLGYVDLPGHSVGGFDHGDVHKRTGRVFVAHTANGAVEVIEGKDLRHVSTIPGCPEASGVLCAQDEGLVFAAARGAGKILVIDAVEGSLLKEASAGPRPNGLAWDTRRKSILVADVEDNRARVLDPSSGSILGSIPLPGRPRWCVYDSRLDLFLVNVKEPSGVLAISAETRRGRFIPVSVAGAHGVDIDRTTGRAFVACDGKAVVVLDLAGESEVGVVPISGEPDAVWYNTLGEKLYCAIGRPGVVDVVDASTLAVVERIETEEGAHTTAFDEARQRLYVFLPGSCRASAYQERGT